MSEERIDGRSQRRDAKRSREYVTVCGDVAYVRLTHGQVALIDAADAAEVGESLWHVDSDGYPVRAAIKANKRRRQALHRFLLCPPLGMQVDHVNCNPLDNRRANLRLCTKAQNQCNRRPAATYGGVGVLCRYKGVSMFQGKFRAQIKAGQQRKWIGDFATAIEAAQAYDRAAINLHGKFARVNFGGAA